MLDYTDGKTFWKWYFSKRENWLFGLGYNGMGLIVIGCISMDPFVSPFWYALVVGALSILWVLTIREYRKLKKGISE